MVIGGVFHGSCQWPGFRSAIASCWLPGEEEGAGGHIQVLVERGARNCWSETMLVFCVLCLKPFGELAECQLMVYSRAKCAIAQSNAFYGEYVVVQSKTMRNVFPTLHSTFYFRPHPLPRLATCPPRWRRQQTTGSIINSWSGIHH